MKFELNGEVQEIDRPLNVSGLLEQYDLLRRRVAIAINTRVIPRSRFGEVEIREGDHVDVIQAVGGG